MPFPDSPRVLFRRNPLVEVLCQLKFPPILSIAATEPAEFQERIRGEYPFYTKQSGPPVPQEITQALGILKIPGPEVVRHGFAIEDEQERPTREIALANDFLALTDRRYHRWETFRDSLMRARRGLEEIYRPAFYSRIGLRYIDVFSRSAHGLAETPWEELIREELVGSLTVEEVQQRVFDLKSLLLLKVPEVEGAMMRVLYGLLPDKPGSQDKFTVDIDIYTEQRSEATDVQRILDVFHEHAGNFFRWAITDRLRDALDPEPLSGTHAAQG